MAFVIWYFFNQTKYTYHRKLDLNKANFSDQDASLLVLIFTITDRIIANKIYDKNVILIIGQLSSSDLIIGQLSTSRLGCSTCYLHLGSILAAADQLFEIHYFKVDFVILILKSAFNMTQCNDF